ncbi:c-type cytochrome [Paludisphaera borealis]|nr:cytochrome c [Paludisphaera borealis]
MSTADRSPDQDAPAAFDPAAGKWVFMGMLLLMTTGVVGFYAFRPRPVPVPVEVLNDPTLLLGRTVYMARCVGCHGVEGRGDGPIAGSLTGPPVGDLADGKWKHGDRPEDVVAVISRGVPDTRMSGWGQLLEDDELKAVAAYCYYLSKAPIPESLRGSGGFGPVAPR